MRGAVQDKFCNVKQFDKSEPPKSVGFHPSRKWPNAASGRTQSMPLIDDRVKGSILPMNFRG